MRGAGWSYEEAGDRLGISDTRVNQLVSRAHQRLREIEVREIEPRSDRARRLASIERDPPVYLVNEIGWPPRANPKEGGHEVRREWCRLALEIEDFRVERNVNDPRLALGNGPPDPGREALEHRVSEFTRARQLGRDRGISE